jgi:Ca2+-binding RTX toxin-like protein
MVGEAGTDQFDGGLGFDFVSYFNSTGAVTVNLGLNRLNGGQAAGETYTSVEGVFGSRFSDNIVGDNNANALFGGDGADVLFGLGGSDVLKGDGGADRLNGGWGQDTIDGGAGNDTLTGEAGADRFVFGTGWGHDRITDYQRGIDQKLDFTGVAGLDSFSQLAITSGAAGALVTFAGNTLLLAGVHGSALTSSDFML